MRRHWVPSRGVGRARTQSRSPGQGQAGEGVVPGSARTHRAPGEQRGGTGGGPSKGPEILGQGQGPPEEQPGLKQGARPWKGTPRVRALLDSRTQGKGQGLGGKGGQAMAQGEVGSRHRSTAGGGVWWGGGGGLGEQGPWAEGGQRDQARQGAGRPCPLGSLEGPGGQARCLGAGEPPGRGVSQAKGSGRGRGRDSAGRGGGGGAGGRDPSKEPSLGT